MNAARLKQARLLLGLTQTGVVAELSRIGISITSAAISGYEKGRSSPSLRVLGGLGRVYHRDLSFFMTSSATTVTWTGFRKNTALPASGQKAIKARAEMLFAHYLELKQTLEPDENTAPWAEMTSGDSPEAMEASAENFRGRFGLGLEPIPSLTGLLERNGGLMVELETPHDFDGLSGLVNDRIPSLVLRKGTPVDRRRFSIAHEIAHLAFGVTDEKLAHRFASALLAPCEAVFSEVGRTRTRIDIDELLILKERYGLSMQAWMRRCRDLGIITEACYSSFCMTASARGWRRDEPGSCPQIETPSRFRQMVLRAQAEGLITKRHAQDLLCESACGTQAPEEPGTELKRLLTLLPNDRTKALLPILEAAAADYLASSDLDLGDFADEVIRYD